jgi:hypothetical protein
VLLRYVGPPPSNARKDAKYSVVRPSADSGSTEDEIRLIHWVGRTKFLLLTSSQHPELVNKINEAKIELKGRPRGTFYINEFCDVLIPAGSGGCYWVGHYDQNLEFSYEGSTLSPKAPSGLQPGQIWPGPHVGIRYILSVRDQDIEYIRHESRVDKRIVLLSEEVGAEAAGKLVRRLISIMGYSGGRFYVNERGELFSPGRAPDGVGAVYLGNLDDVLWFSPPDDFPRP